MDESCGGGLAYNSEAALTIPQNALSAFSSKEVCLVPAPSTTLPFCTMVILALLSFFPSIPQALPLSFGSLEWISAAFEDND